MQAFLEPAHCSQPSFSPDQVFPMQSLPPVRKSVPLLRFAGSIFDGRLVTANHIFASKSKVRQSKKRSVSPRKLRLLPGVKSASHSILKRGRVESPRFGAPNVTIKRKLTPVPPTKPRPGKGRPKTHSEH